jgi:hypothetical protein
LQLQELVSARLAAQRLDGSSADGAAGVVRHLLAVAAPDLERALWSVAMRLPTPDAEVVAAAYDDGTILRTHALRSQPQLVHRDDVRWLLDLSAPRVEAVLGARAHALDLSATLLERGRKALGRALRGTVLTLPEVSEVLERARVRVAGERLALLLAYAELHQVVTSGPRRDRTPTYARFDDRVPREEVPHRTTALRDLTVRFLTSHGPATAADLRDWATLTAADVRSGLEQAGTALRTVEVAGRTFHLDVDAQLAPGGTAPLAHLVSPDDELLAGTLASRDLHDPDDVAAGFDPERFTGLVLVDGHAVGYWKRTLRTGSVHIEVALHRQLRTDERDALQHAADRFGAYVGSEASVVQVPLR